MYVERSGKGETGNRSRLMLRGGVEEDRGRWGRLFKYGCYRREAQITS